MEVLAIVTPAPVAESVAAAPLAFERLVEEHESRVRRLAQRLLGWSGDAEDVVQDVFLAAYRKPPRLDGAGAAGAWLARLTINACRSRHRRRFLFLRFLRRSAPVDAAPDDPAAENAETARRVQAAVRALPAPLREAVVLRYLEELPAEEVAALLGLSRAAVDVRLHRARERLRETLGSLWREETA